MRFIDIKTDGGRIKGKIALYCEVLQVSRQGFYWFLKYRDDPWKYEGIAEKMRAVVAEDECNDTYGRSRMHDALIQKFPAEDNAPVVALCESLIALLILSVIDGMKLSPEEMEAVLSK